MSVHRAPRVLVVLAVAALLVVGVVGVTASSSAASGKSPIKIGVDVSLTGPFAPLGQSTKRGIELAANRINSAGGIDGRKIALTVLDDATNPATAISNTNTLISDGVDAIIGYNGGQTQVPPAGILTRHHILTVALSGYNPGQPYGPQMFFAPPTLTTHVDAIACYATKVAKAKKVGIISTNDAGATAVNDAVAAALRHDRVSVSSRTVPLGAADVTVAASAIRDAKTRLIFDDAVGATGGLAAQTLRNLGVRTPILGWLAWEQAAVLNIYKSALNGVVMEGFISPTDPLSFQKTFIHGWNHAYPGVPADAYGGWGYDSLNAVADAFKSVPNATQSSGATLARAMRQIHYRGVVGSWKLGVWSAKNPETHTGMQLSNVIWYKIENGALVALRPQPKCG